MCMVCSENDLRESILERIIYTTVFSYEVPTLRTQESKTGIGWGLG